MKITKDTLKQLIKEEMAILKEFSGEAQEALMAALKADSEGKALVDQRYDPEVMQNQRVSYAKKINNILQRSEAGKIYGSAEISQFVDQYTEEMGDVSDDGGSGHPGLQPGAGQLDRIKAIPYSIRSEYLSDIYLAVLEGNASAWHYLTSNATPQDYDKKSTLDPGALQGLLANHRRGIWRMAFTKESTQKSRAQAYAIAAGLIGRYDPSRRDFKPGERGATHTDRDARKYIDRAFPDEDQQDLRTLSDIRRHDPHGAKPTYKSKTLWQSILGQRGDFAGYEDPYVSGDLQFPDYRPGSPRRKKKRGKTAHDQQDRSATGSTTGRRGTNVREGKITKESFKDLIKEAASELREKIIYEETEIYLDEIKLERLDD